jgi:hypothetical protein
MIALQVAEQKQNVSNVSLLRHIRNIAESAEPSIQWVLGILSQGVKTGAERN